jgi:hypothetical protein
MAALPVTLVGVDQNGNAVAIVGSISMTGVGVGGGPVMPPWWPGHPEHPIPPTVWPTPPTGGSPLPPWWPGHPEHPIPPVVWPTPPIQPPGGGTPPQGPQIEWKVAWSPTTGWIVVGIPSGEHPTPSEGSSA